MLTLRSIALELTPRCNQQCVYCYNPWRGSAAESGKELATSEVCGLIDRILSEAELEHVTLTGGEPFVREDIFGIIGHINRRGLPVAIISNGGLIDERSAKLLAERDVAYLQVTFAGPDAASHDALCGPGSFERTARGATMLAAAGVALGGSFLCTRRSFAATEQTLELMRELGIRQHFAFNRFNPSGHATAYLTELMPTRSEALVALRAADRFAATHDLTVHCTMPIPHCMVDEEDYPRIRFGQCSAGCEEAEYAVDPQGRLKLCTLQQRPIGSLFEARLGELVASEPARRFREMIPSFCDPCPHRTGCLGGCGAAAEWVFGRADELDPFLAQHVMVDFPQRVAILERGAKPRSSHDS